MKRILLFVATLTVLIVPAVVTAQELPQGPPAGQGGSQTSSVDTQGIRNYLLGPGDVIDVRVFGQPDLNSIAEVDSDGNISSLPFLEAPIPARCRSEKEIQKSIAEAYEKYLKKAQVSVRITGRNSRPPATVFGAVRQPTRVQMQRRVRLNELMAVSGGFTERAAGTIQILHTEPLMCPGPGEEAEAAAIDWMNPQLKIISVSDLRMNKPQANPIVRPGDYILVTEAEPVYITGSVISPQGVFMKEHLTLSRALAMVGGPTKAAKTSDIRVYRQKPTGEQETLHIDYAAIKKGAKPDFMLQAYDIIDVPEAGLLSGGRLGQTLLSAITGSVGTALSSTTSILPTKVLY